MKNCLSWSVTIDAAKLDFVSDAYQVQIQAALDITDFGHINFGVPEFILSKIKTTC